jgi:hypothetical protein
MEYSNLRDVLANVKDILGPRWMESDDECNTADGLGDEEEEEEKDSKEMLEDWASADILRSWNNTIPAKEENMYSQNIRKNLTWSRNISIKYIVPEEPWGGLPQRWIGFTI